MTVSTAATLYFAKAVLKTGEIVASDAQDSVSESLRDLASASAELFALAEPSALAEVFARAGSTHSGDSLEEILVISRNGSYAVRRDPKDREHVFLAASTERGRLGMTLSSLHARLQDGAKLP
jgi:hypothetical protein